MHLYSVVARTLSMQSPMRAAEALTVGVAGDCPNMSMAPQLPDHREALVERQRP